ncbi:MAG: PDZ domain-containing protein [Chromatiales bacterium]|jgi:hypothetical protein
MKQLHMLGILLLALFSSVQAASTTDIKAPPAAMLGVQLADVPDALRSHLGDALPVDQGVLVVDVLPDGPADKAGIQQHDVILAYADQKLFAVRQLVALVRDDKPGQQVQLQLLRVGKSQQVAVELGESRMKHWRRQDQPYRHHRSLPVMPFGQSGPDTPQVPMAWDEFESIQVQTLPDGRYRAEVKYKNESDESKSLLFEGKREEIIEQIKQQKDIPEDKKQALLQTLNMDSMDSLRDRMFNDPFFQRYFDGDAFFRDFPDMRMPYWRHR